MDNKKGAIPAVEAKVQAFDELTTRELYEILKARAKVFVVEQHCMCLDMDGVDFHSLHVTILNDGEVVAYARVFKDVKSGNWHIGRVLSTVRGMHYGYKVMQESIAAAQCRGASIIDIDAQSYAVGFYEKLGFEVVSDEFVLEGILHKKMRWQP